MVPSPAIHSLQPGPPALASPLARKNMIGGGTSLAVAGFVVPGLIDPGLAASLAGGTEGGPGIRGNGWSRPALAGAHASATMTAGPASRPAAARKNEKI